MNVLGTTLIEDPQITVPNRNLDILEDITFYMCEFVPINIICILIDKNLLIDENYFEQPMVQLAEDDTRRMLKLFHSVYKFTLSCNHDKDQQKRERLSKAVKNQQKEVLHYHSTSPMNYSSVSPATSRFRDKNLMKRPFQDPQKKTYSGDLLDKHSNWFTEARQAFTPRTLRNRAKSFLLKYKYYTAPKNMQGNPSVTPTYNESFTDKSPVPFHLETDCPVWYQSQGMRELNPRIRHSSSSVKLKLMAWEDEMKYLQFLKEVTDDILCRGYHSNRILENIFQIHVERSKYHLNEVNYSSCLMIHAVIIVCTVTSAYKAAVRV
ncbi:spermatogenesis-associated protein 7 homolog [Hemiscyllium ocellatum]|uniref:spermatogenesis-associated protein 7 homolog n=1 Tax=Hemiscyllium ocellatum TaxID=170820 RepID=UPI00296758F2|nr:spermatogenesis-associated protein 7 homolog [Hemiscyllium ocellatum]